MPRSPKLLWKDPLILVMIIILLGCLGFVAWIFYTIFTSVEMTSLREQTFAIRLMQVTLGMVIGLALAFLGVVAAWFGITESVAAEMTAESVRTKLVAAGPGTVLVLCGTVLIYVCIQKEFRITDRTPIPEVRSQDTSQKPS